MIGLALRGLAERKLRSSLTAIAVLLGVAMIAGTYVLTDQIRGGFEDLQASVYSGIDVELTPKKAFVSSQFQSPQTLDATLVGGVGRVPGVAKAEGDLWAPGALVIDGKLQKSTGGGGTIVTTASGEPFNPAADLKGRLPERSGEVAVLRDTAEKHELEPGDPLGIATRSGTKTVRVVGAYDIGTTDAGGTDIVSAPLEDIQRWYGQQGEVTTINVAAEEGVSPEELVRRIREVVPDSVDIRTGEAASEATAAEVNDQIGGFLTPTLLAFAGAALLVGAFIIFNTFTITVAERTREIALLRTLGATRGQVMGGVAVEALAIGIVASAAGLALGLLVAKGLANLFEAAGLGIPTAGLELAPRTIALALSVGVGITLVSALAPARRATRVPPMAALQRGDQGQPTRSRRYAPWAAGVVVAMGIALVIAGLHASGSAASRLGLMGLGVVLLFIGVALSARWFVRPLAGAVGWPLERLFAEPGLLARENAMRNPGRTATTAASLMVGLGLVVFVGVFANGIKASVDATIGDLVNADLIVRSDSSFQPVPEGAVDALTRTPEVGAASEVVPEQIEVNGESSSALTDILNGVNPASLAKVYEPDWVGTGSEGTLGRLRGNAALVEEQFSKAHDIGVFDSFMIRTPSGGEARLTAVGRYRDPQLLQGTIVSQELFERMSPARDPWLILVQRRSGASVEAARRAVEHALEPFPLAKVDSQAEYTESIRGQIDQIIYLLYALLAMSVVISLFGIANSLFLSIHERTREFGLLRAVGMTRGQVREMVRYESVITAIIGGLLGTAIGVLFAFLVTQALSNLGLSFALPAGQLVVFLVVAVGVGVIAAVIPARRGSRLQVLDALRAE